MADIQKFINPEFGTIRSVLIDNEPWLVGKDVAEILGYTNPQKAIRDHVDEEDKGVNESFTPGGKQNLIVINESGFYSLVLSSKLPDAKKFKHWVTSEVLPSIRKHGVYAKEELLNDLDLFISALTELKAERVKNAELQQANEMKSLQIAMQNQHIAEQNVAIAHMQPKADYCDIILRCPDSLRMTSIAKDYGWSATSMNKYLHKKRVQYKQGGQWILYQHYAKQGYTKSEPKPYRGSDGKIHSREWTVWTQKGRKFIYELLKSDGILPLVEQPEFPLPNVPQYQPPAKKESD